LTKITEETIQGTGGKLFVRSWRPDASRGVVAVCHGFNAHSGYYGWVGDQLAGAGLAAYALDLRGRGKSDGERFYVEKIDNYVDDVTALIRHCKSREPGLPVYLLGHSAGGVTSVIYALDHQNEIVGLICEDFAFQVPAPDFVLAVLKGLAHLAPHSGAITLKNEDFSRDPAQVKAMDNDPLIAHEKQPFQTMSALVHADERLKREFSEIRLPVLIIHGAADKAAKPSGSKEFFDRAGSVDKTLKIYDGRFHDMLNDLGREEVMADIIGWVIARVPAHA
jgi:alpha-beta hydrolase superfamily lysophospholipase